MFSVLDDKERDIVIGAMEECRFKPNDVVIKQGDPGEILYVIDEGNLDCFKKFTKDAQDTYLKTYQPGEAFGELALLYNAPRAATIIAKTDCLLWSLDRECFNIIVKDAARKKREAFEDTLNKVTILENLDPYEKSRLGDGV
jgi:cAMP-dependent protein kinase regulator